LPDFFPAIQSVPFAPFSAFHLFVIEAGNRKKNQAKSRYDLEAVKANLVL
jgi:hypothetical protein